MIARTQSGGARQKAWDALRRKAWPSAAELARHIGTSESGLRSYIGALMARDYVVRHADGSIELVNKTGSRCPSWSVHTDDFRDWNLEPAMSGKELGRIIKRSGLTLRQWLVKNGLDASEQTRLRQMVNGQRPVSGRIAAAAQEN